jgi:hypothetical protein
MDGMIWRGQMAIIYYFITMEGEIIKYTLNKYRTHLCVHTHVAPGIGLVLLLAICERRKFFQDQT